MGQRQRALAAALEALDEHPRVRVLRRASLYETEPLGVEDQPWFLNTAAQVETTLPPSLLLAACKAVEQRLGRVPRGRWGPREVDVDLLLYGDWVLLDPELRVPHLQLPHRQFVLVPLLELAPGGIDPLSGRRLAELSARLGQAKKVRLFAKRY